MKLKYKTVQAKCPNCGAKLPLEKGQRQVTCLFCKTTVTVEHEKPASGTFSASSATVIRVDPRAFVAPRLSLGCGLVIAGAIAAPIAISLFVSLGSVHVINHSFEHRLGAAGAGNGAGDGAAAPASYPITCEPNQTVEISGDWSGPGAVIAAAGANCKIHIHDAKLKAEKLLDSGESNLELRLTHVTLETSGEGVRAGANFHFTLAQSQLTSARDAILNNDSNLVLAMEGSKLTSTGGAALRSSRKDSGVNLSVTLADSSIQAQKTALAATDNLRLTLRGASAITSEDTAVTAETNAKVRVEGGAIRGKQVALTAGSNLELTMLPGTELQSSEGVALKPRGNAKLTLDDARITGKLGAIAGAVGVVEASNGTRIVATEGDAIAGTIARLDLDNVTVEGARAVVTTSYGSELTLRGGTRVIGRHGAILGGNAPKLEARDATIEGGDGPGLAGKQLYGLRFSGGKIAGEPALLSPDPLLRLEVDGTEIVGGKVRGALPR